MGVTVRTGLLAEVAEDLAIGERAPRWRPYQDSLRSRSLVLACETGRHVGAVDGPAESLCQRDGCYPHAWALVGSADDPDSPRPAVGDRVLASPFSERATHPPIVTTCVGDEGYHGIVVEEDGKRVLVTEWAILPAPWPTVLDEVADKEYIAAYAVGPDEGWSVPSRATPRQMRAVVPVAPVAGAPQQLPATWDLAWDRCPSCPAPVFPGEPHTCLSAPGDPEREVDELLAAFEPQTERPMRTVRLRVMYRFQIPDGIPLVRCGVDKTLKLPPMHYSTGIPGEDGSKGTWRTHPLPAEFLTYQHDWHDSDGFRLDEPTASGDPGRDGGALHEAAEASLAECMAHERAVAEVERVRQAAATTSSRVEQTLGAALGYPVGGCGEVAVGDHVPESLAMEAAERIAGLGAEAERLRALASKGSPLEVQDCESFTEWAIVRTAESYAPGTLFSDSVHRGTEESARKWAQQFIWPDKPDQVVLASRRVVRTKWEAV